LWCVSRSGRAFARADDRPVRESSCKFRVGKRRILPSLAIASPVTNRFDGWTGGGRVRPTDEFPKGALTLCRTMRQATRASSRSPAHHRRPAANGTPRITRRPVRRDSASRRSTEGVLSFLSLSCPVRHLMFTRRDAPGSREVARTVSSGWNSRRTRRGQRQAARTSTYMEVTES